jgi:hypothetical protein
VTMLNAAEVSWTAETVTLGTHVWPGRITDGPERYVMLSHRAQRPCPSRKQDVRLVYGTLLCETGFGDEHT